MNKESKQWWTVASLAGAVLVVNTVLIANIDEKQHNEPIKQKKPNIEISPVQVPNSDIEKITPEELTQFATR